MGRGQEWELNSWPCEGNDPNMHRDDKREIVKITGWRNTEGIQERIQEVMLSLSLYLAMVQDAAMLLSAPPDDTRLV